jgi:hypothetical protein
MSTATPSSTGVEQQLAWEKVWRPRAVVLFAVAGIVQLGLYIVPNVLYKAPPKGDANALLFVHQHAGSLLALAIAGAAMFPVGAAGLVILYRATAFRRPQIPNATVPLVVIGSIALAVLYVVHQAQVGHAASQFAAGAVHTDAQARHDANSGSYLQIPLLVSGAIFGAGVALTSFHAMKAGLLTPAVGYTGLAGGILTVIGFELIIVVWFIIVAVTLSGRTRAGLLPAWRSGEAVPWPSQQEIRERRLREREQRQRGRGRTNGRGAPPAALPEADDDDESVAAGAGPSPATSQRKRKRTKRR